MYIDKLDDIVNEYNNTYHRTIKMKPVDAKDNTYTNFGKEVNDKDPKFKNQEKVRIEKVIQKKETSYMSSGKDMIVHLIAGFVKRMLYQNESIFS